jgi:hypothetical protein
MRSVIRHRPGYDGWLAVAATVLIAEALDTRTMSSAWRMAPKRVTVPIAAYTLAHLYGLLPEQYDLFIWASKVPIPRRERK